MKRLTTVVSAALAAAIGVACHSDPVGPVVKGRDTIAATYEAAWVGFYEGMGGVDLLEVGKSYGNLPICVEAWPEAGRLRAVVYIQILPAPDALIEISDGPYSDDHKGVCAGIGVMLTAGGRIENITSSDALMLSGPDGSSVADWSAADDKRHSLQFERRGTELVGLLRVYRPGSKASATVSPSEEPEVARFTARLTKAY
ncbi:MAG: hypothetical protein JSW71_03195 [Gemmatimonadota bacterium]|nr:MAG: hypothetical protein JSW71_03195 [Gemmatimonadota bacterium]